MEIARKQNTAILKPKGKIDIRNSKDFKNNMLKIYDEGYCKVIIDFEKVESIDSSGLGKLLLFQKKLKERSGELKIINISSEYIKKMFTMIHLDKVINIEV